MCPGEAGRWAGGPRGWQGIKGCSAQASSAGKPESGLLGIRWGEVPTPQLFFRQGNAAADFGLSFKKQLLERIINWWKETGGSSNTRTARELCGSAALGGEKTQTCTAAVTTETGHGTGVWVTQGIDRYRGNTRDCSGSIQAARVGRLP